MLSYTLLVLGCVDLSWSLTLDQQVVKDVLLYKNSQRVVIMGFNDGRIVPFAKNLIRSGIFVHYDTSLKKPFALPKPNQSFSIIADMNCPTVRENIKKDEFQHKFNTSYTWIFFAHEYKLQDLLLEKERRLCLRLDSDVLWIQKAANNSFYHLIDLFALSSTHGCGSYRTTQIGHWRKESGLHIIDGFNKVKLRKNFQQTMLRALLLHSTPDMLETKLNQMNGNDMGGILGHELFHYALLSFLQQEHNFLVNFQQSKQELSDIKPNYDVVASGVFQSLRSNPLNVQILLQSWTYRLGFIFRLTPELNGATRESSYLSPFTNATWYSIVSILTFVLVVLQCVTMVHKELPLNDRNHFLIDTIGLIAQQGTAQSSAHISLRIVLYAVLMMNFLLYNYYSASIVGELLSSSNRGPRTIDQLLKVPLYVMFHNDSYNRELSMDIGSSILMYRFLQKLPHTTTMDNFEPIYVDVHTAVRLLKLGGYAFHCELTEAFREIANHFEANEICELRTLEGLYIKLPLMSFVLPKQSMYTEQFKITLFRATEVGFVQRLLRTYRNDLPACQGGPLVHPTVLAGLTTPFTVLAAGFASSLIVFTLEKIVYSVQNISQQE